MNAHHGGGRVLAINVRRTRFGYVLLEGPQRLIDWGTCSVSPKLSGREAFETARRRIIPLLERCSPTVAVVKPPRRTKSGGSSTPGPILRTVLREAAALKLPVRVVTLDDINETFRTMYAHNKDDVARVLVELFPELTARLPPRRGKWGVERPRMMIFDALAAGFTYWQQVVVPPE